MLYMAYLFLENIFRKNLKLILYNSGNSVE